MYQPLHPAILRLIHHTVEAGHRAGIPVALCGEMAGEPLYIPILLGLGLDELSMNPLSIPRVKRIIRMISYQESKEFLSKTLTLKTTEEVNNFVHQAMVARFAEGFKINGTMIY
jgi:phosphotransferase system enzyme I (PtsI)